MMAIQETSNLPTSRWSKNVINIENNSELELSSYPWVCSSSILFTDCSVQWRHLNASGFYLALSIKEFHLIWLSEAQQRGKKLLCQFLLSYLLVFSVCGEKDWECGSAQHDCACIFMDFCSGGSCIACSYKLSPTDYLFIL